MWIFSFYLNSKSYPIVAPDVYALGFWSGWIAIAYASYHFQNRSVSTPLRNENDAEKNLFQWKQKVCPIWKLDRSDNDPVWWKHSIDLFFKVACRVKTNALAPWTTKDTTSSHYFSKKLKPILCRVIKGTWKSLNGK